MCSSISPRSRSVARRRSCDSRRDSPQGAIRARTGWPSATDALRSRAQLNSAPTGCSGFLRDIVTSNAPDRAAHRAWLVGLTVLPSGGTAVDLGCGRGEDLGVLAQRHPDAGRLVGVDASAAALAAAAAGTTDGRIT